MDTLTNMAPLEEVFIDWASGSEKFKGILLRIFMCNWDHVIFGVLSSCTFGGILVNC